NGSNTFGPNGLRNSSSSIPATVRTDQTPKRVAATLEVQARGLIRIENGKQKPTTKSGAQPSTNPAGPAWKIPGRKTFCTRGSNSAGANAMRAGMMFFLNSSSVSTRELLKAAQRSTGVIQTAFKDADSAAPVLIGRLAASAGITFTAVRAKTQPIF